MAEKYSRESLDSRDESYWYERSALSKWLRYDMWKLQFGLPLICNIDIQNSGRSDTWTSLVLTYPESAHLLYDDFADVALLSEDPIYQLTPIKTPTSADLAHDMRRLAALKRDSSRDDVKIDSEDVRVRMSERHHACMKLSQAHEIFMSNPNHGETDTFSPAYFLSWAASKRIDIPWLDWAKEQNLVDLSDAIVNRSDFGTVVSRPNLGTRERNTLLVVIAALCEECDIDPKQKSMTKRVVGMTEKIGAPLSDDTIRQILKSLAPAVECRTKN